MTYASTYDPSHYAHLADVFPRLFKGFFDEPGTAPAVRRAEVARVARVAAFAVDVHEDEAAYTLVGNLPGFSKDDIKIEIDGNQINIRAESQTAKPVQTVESGQTTQASASPSSTVSPKVLRHERYSGAFARGFSLPVEIDDAQSQAKYENGVLTLTLPKKLQTSAKRVSIVGTKLRAASQPPW